MDRIDELPLFSSTKQQPPQPLSVSALTAKIKKQVEPNFVDVWVRGELSNLRPSSSGHLYFTLKDDSAGLSAVLFGWKRVLKNQKIRDGLEVVVSGRISVYAPRGTYQLVVSKLELLGAGALQLEFERLKEKLKLEGLFSENAKKPIPHYPKSIAIVTSASGAALRDIISVIERRAPWIRLTVIPCRVQGEGAAIEISRAIKQVERIGGFDVMILARGGGSIEDLWCFNDEELARIIHRTKVPTISAVGHEIDFTISDFVSDLRAATPSAAAELVSNQWSRAIEGMEALSEELIFLIRRQLEKSRADLAVLADRIRSPKDRLLEQAQRCDEWSERLGRGMKLALEKSQESLSRFSEKLHILSPLSVLSRGYSIVRDSTSQAAVVSAKSINTGQKLLLKFRDGEVGATAD